MNNTMRTTLLFLLTTMSLNLWGQNFTYQANVDSVKGNGFYNIVLSPEITAQLNNHFSDIRLYSDESEIPYLLHKEKRVTEHELFVPYKIIELKHSKKQGYTRIVIHNPDKTSINNIVLRIKNADVRKKLKLNASNNNFDWYVLKDNYEYNSIYNSENTAEIRVLNFPFSDYEYYELLIDDYYDKPINITQAGFYNQVKELGNYTQIKSLVYTTKDTLKETIIKLPIGGNSIDKLAFEIVTPKYFYRQAEVYRIEKTSIKKKESAYEKTIGTFNLISNSNNTFNTNNIKEDTLYIRIRNNDNAPLTIKNIKAYQLNKYLTAELINGNYYYLKYNNSSIEKPNYDLKYFTDSIPDKLPTIRTLNRIKIPTSEEVLESGNLNLRNYWLWISIIIVAGLLIFMSLKMVKDINKTKGQ